MNSTWLGGVAGITVIGVASVFAHCMWRRDAHRAVVEWCAANCVAIDHSTFEFYMGRPARVIVAGTQGEERYWFKLTLSSGLFNLPSSVFRVWGKVALQDRFRIE